MSNRKAQALSVDVLLSMIVFLFLILVAYWLYTSSSSQTESSFDDRIFTGRYEALSNSLLYSSGTPNWNTLNATQLNATKALIGLSSSSYGVLDIDKVLYLVALNTSYETIRTLLVGYDEIMIKYYVYNATSKLYNDNATYSFGRVNTSLRVISREQIFVMNNTLTLVQLTLSKREGAAAAIVLSAQVNSSGSLIAGTYQYLRWNISSRKGDNCCGIQLAEFQILVNGTVQNYTNVSISAPNVGGGENDSNAVDGNIATKWRSNFAGPVDGEVSATINMGSKIYFNQYRYITAEDAETRDPNSWSFEGSPDGSNWTVLDYRRNQTITSSRNVATQTFGIFNETNISPFEFIDFTVLHNETRFMIRNNAYYNITINNVRSGCFNYRTNASVVAGTIYEVPLLEMLNISVNGWWVNYTGPFGTFIVSTPVTDFSCPATYSNLVFYAPGDGYSADISTTNTNILRSPGLYSSDNISQARRSFTLNGISDIAYANTSALNPSSAVSISFWWKPNTFGSGWTSLIYKGTNDSSRQYAMFTSSSLHAHASFGGVNYLNGNISSLSYGWNHITMTYNYSSGAFDLYTNGINVNTTYASTMTPGTDLFIGSQIDVFERANGSIDDIMIFNKKLNDSEVATLGDLKKYRYQYRYLYLNITQRRADAYKMQIGELELFKYGTNVNIPHPYILQSISTPGSSSDGGQGPDKLIDGTSTTKYLGGNWPVGVYGSSNITIDLGRMLEFNQYRFLTADDDPTRDPVSWTLWGSVDNVAYVLLDNVTAATITSSRQTATQLFNITG